MAAGRLVRGLMIDRRTCLATALGKYVGISCSVGRDLLLGKVVRCSCDLLVPAGAVRVAASATRFGAPRTVALVHITVLNRTGLNPITVILNEIMNVVVQVLVSFPGAAAVAVLLVQCLVRAEC